MIESLYQQRVAEVLEAEASKHIRDTGTQVQSNYEHRVGYAKGLLRALDILVEVDKAMQKGE